MKANKTALPGGGAVWDLPYSVTEERAVFLAFLLLFVPVMSVIRGGIAALLLLLRHVILLLISRLGCLFGSLFVFPRNQAGYEEDHRRAV